MEWGEATCAEPMGDSGGQRETLPLLIPECRGVSHHVFFFFLAELGLSCGTGDFPFSLWHSGSLVETCSIVPQPGIEPRPLALGAWSLSH